MCADLQAPPCKSATWRTRVGGEATLFDGSGAARSAVSEDLVQSNGVAPGGGPRPPPETGLSAPCPSGIHPRILLAR